MQCTVARGERDRGVEFQAMQQLSVLKNSLPYIPKGQTAIQNSNLSFGLLPIQVFTMLVCFCTFVPVEMRLPFSYGVTNRIRKLLHLYQMIGWYKCASLRMWFVMPYYHKIFIFAVLESWLIYDCETECSFVYWIHTRFWLQILSAVHELSSSRDFHGRQSLPDLWPLTHDLENVIVVM